VKKNRQKRAVFGYFVVAYVLVVTVFTVFRYYDESTKWDEIVRTRLRTGAAMVKYVMPNGYFDRATNKDSVPEKEFRELTLALSKATWESQFEYIYALKEMNGRYYFIASSLTRKAGIH
jgi:hypothetical protein